MPYNLVEVYRRFGGTYCLRFQGEESAEYVKQLHSKQGKDWLLQ
jgi:hypothetical protein